MHPRINPPRGRRPWIIPEDAEASGLSYLAWGRRRYGDDPIPVDLQAGYVYLLVLRGHPLLRFEDGTFECAPGTFFILHPDRPMGWSGTPGEEHEILCWIWRKPPALAELRPAPGGWLRWHLPTEAVEALAALHRATRNELARRDAYSALALRQKQTDLDIAIARRIAPKSTSPESDLPETLRLALEWIDSHPGSTRPVADLCDRLALSPSRLARLFKRHFGSTPLQYVNTHKSRLATRRLQAGEPVKSVALDLGYRHVHDFSRFFRHQTGRRPSDLVRAGAAAFQSKTTASDST
mgnify:CR=1 FL=1